MAFFIRTRSSPRLAIVAAGLLLVAAGIHLVLTPEHFEEKLLYGVFFLAASVVQLALVGLLLLRPSPSIYRVGVLSSAGLIVTWIVTRAFSTPLVPQPEPVTFAGVVASSVELGALFLLAVALPLGGAGSGPAPRFAWRWAAVAGPAFVLLVLFATGSLAYVHYDLSETGAVPRASLDAGDGFSFRSPWLFVAFTDRLVLSTSWSVAVFLLLAGTLVSLTAGLAVGLARCGGACRPQTGGVLAVAPAFVVAPTCCGAALPVGFALGGGTLMPVLAAGPWLLLGSSGLLTANLLLLRRRWRTAKASV